MNRQSAFPHDSINTRDDRQYFSSSTGISLRDYFAIHASDNDIEEHRGPYTLEKTPKYECDLCGKDYRD